MNCPTCKSASKVVDVRLNGVGLRRRYLCKNQHRFTTYAIERLLKSNQAKITIELVVDDMELKHILADKVDQYTANVARNLQKIFKDWEEKKVI